jgi:hypothetical protein
MFKNKRKKITAIAAAALCFSSNVKTSNAQEVIIVSDGGGVVLDPVKNTEHESEKDSGSGVSSLLWPAALAAVGGLAGTLAGKKSSPKDDDKSVSNNSSATWIGSTIGALAGVVVSNKLVRKKVWTPVYNFFAKLFGSKKNIPDATTTPLENPDYEKNMKIISNLLDSFVDSIVVLQFIRFPELLDSDKSNMMSIIKDCSFRYEFINEIVVNYIDNIVNLDLKKSKNEMCEELKKKIYNKIRNSVSSLGAERLINNLEEANKKFSLIIEKLDAKNDAENNN